MPYTVDEPITLQETFKDSEGNTVTVTEPVEVEIRHENNVDAYGPFSATKVSGDTYKYTYTPRQGGQYYYRFISDDPYVEEGSFYVELSQVKGEGAYKGIITVDELWREVGSPAQDPNSDTYFPKENLGDIINRHLERFESEIERQLNDKGPKIVAHLSEEYVIRVSKNFTTQGIAGARLPEDVVAYIYRAVLSVRTQLEYDTELDRIVGREVPGIKRHKIRLSGRDIEVLPNEDKAVTCYLVPRQRAIEGIMPHVISDINQAIKQEAAQAVQASLGMRSQFKQQSKEVSP